MASSTSIIGGGFRNDFDLIKAISLYSDECYQKQSPDFLNEEHDFSRIHIGKWDGEHCVSWVLSTCHENGIDTLSVDLGLLGSTSGMLLLKSSKQDFYQMMGDTLGKIMYREMKLLKGRKKNVIYHDSEEFIDSNSLELGKDSCGKVATTSKRQERVPRNWEFLIRLLADPRANPKLIRWEDEAQGTFILVKPDIITSLWNSRSNKPPISYNNFARGLRYHYKTGALFKVEERPLVYGCGTKAIHFFNTISTKKTPKVKH